jgi:hypothetical protein
MFCVYVLHKWRGSQCNFNSLKTNTQLNLFGRGSDVHTWRRLDAEFSSQSHKFRFLVHKVAVLRISPRSRHFISAPCTLITASEVCDRRDQPAPRTSLTWLDSD